MIVVMTNRYLHDFPEELTKIVDVNKMGCVLGAANQSGHRVHVGELFDNNSKIEFYASGTEDALFSSISEEDKKKPWVFFLHGFHQDPDENIAKAVAIHDNHNVNVINFAWPSKPLDMRYKMDDFKKDMVSGLVTGIEFKVFATTSAYKVVKGYLNDTWENYDPAISNAEASDKDLLAAMTFVSNGMGLQNPPVLLVHSMGNYLLQNTIKEHDKLNMNFNNIILHQADVDCPSYEWVIKLQKNIASRETGDTAKSKLYITTNYADFVLMGSCARRAILKKKSAERLGQNKLHYLKDNVHYFDMSCAPGIGDDHEAFKRKRAANYDETASNGYIDNAIFDWFTRVFQSKSDDLPEQNEEVVAGIMKMPTEILLYRVAEIIDPVGSDEHPDEYDLIEATSYFEDPLKRDENEEED